jgi:peptide/nickel transport system ATP-binding protein
MTGPVTAPVLTVHDLRTVFDTDRGTARAVDGVSFEVAAGEAVGLVGESGCGKSVTALSLLRLIRPPGSIAPGSQIVFDGADLMTLDAESLRRIRGDRIAMVFQEPMTALNPVVRVGAQIEEAIRAHEPRLARDQIRRRALESLKRTAIPEPTHCAHQYPHELSGGLRQRALIAMALAAGPRVLIADEPTTALDVTVQKQILELLAALGRDLKLSMLFITHDFGVVAQIADRVAVMYAGRVVEQGPTDEVLRHPRHPYTEGLLRAAPRLARESLVAIPGTVPPLAELPPGCAFGPRCAKHIAACDAAVPELIHAAAASQNHRARCILVK